METCQNLRETNCLTPKTNGNCFDVAPTWRDTGGVRLVTPKKGDVACKRRRRNLSLDVGP